MNQSTITCCRQTSLIHATYMRAQEKLNTNSATATIVTIKQSVTLEKLQRNAKKKVSSYWRTCCNLTFSCQNLKTKIGGFVISKTYYRHFNRPSIMVANDSPGLIRLFHPKNCLALLMSTLILVLSLSLNIIG